MLIKDAHYEANNITVTIIVTHCFKCSLNDRRVDNIGLVQLN